MGIPSFPVDDRLPRSQAAGHESVKIGNELGSY